MYYYLSNVYLNIHSLVSSPPFLWELEGQNGRYPEVGYILIDSSMISEGIAGFNWANDPTQSTIHLTHLSLDKFFEAPFKLIFMAVSPDNVSVVYLFTVNTSSVDNYLYPLNSSSTTIAIISSEFEIQAGSFVLSGVETQKQKGNYDPYD